MLAIFKSGTTADEDFERWANKMRLIDADRLEYEIVSHIEEFSKVPLDDIINGWKKIVDAQPTAYDVDKVKERLKEYAYGSICGTHEHGCPYMTNDNVSCENCGAIGALEIVKSGGIESLNENGEHMEKSILVIDTPINCTECPLEFDIGDTSGKTLLNANLCRGCGKRNMDSKTKPAWCPLLPYSEA